MVLKWIVVLGTTAMTIEVVHVVNVFIDKFIHIRCGSILVIYIYFEKTSSIFTLLGNFTIGVSIFSNVTLYNIEFESLLDTFSQICVNRCVAFLLSLSKFAVLVQRFVGICLDVGFSDGFTKGYLAEKTCK